MRVVLFEGYPAFHYVLDASVGQRRSDGVIFIISRAARIIFGFPSDMPTAAVLKPPLSGRPHHININVL